MSVTYPAPHPSVAAPLLAAVESLLNRPETLDMGVYYDTDPVCGTTLCLCGQLVTNHYASLAMPVPADVVKTNSWSSAARAITALTVEECSRLFHTIDWPEPFRTRYRAADAALSDLYHVFRRQPDSPMDLPMNRWTDRERAAYRKVAMRRVHILADRVDAFLNNDDHA
jgi:hypothetical protein